MADTRDNATKAFDAFLETNQAKYPKATECLAKDRDELLSFYDFPAEHWKHLRTTNPIESTFATIRLRHRRSLSAKHHFRQAAAFFNLPPYTTFGYSSRRRRRSLSTTWPPHPLALRPLIGALLADFSSPTRPAF